MKITNLGTGTMDIEKNDDGSFTLVSKINIGKKPSDWKIEIKKDSIKRMMNEAKLSSPPKKED